MNNILESRGVLRGLEVNFVQGIQLTIETLIGIPVPLRCAFGSTACCASKQYDWDNTMMLRNLI